MSENNAQQAFNELLSCYYTAWFRFHPETAVQAGVHGYEDLLRPYSDDQIGALITLDEKLLSSLDEFDFSALNADARIDYSLLYNATAWELHQLLDHDWRYSRPQDYVPVNAIHQLLIRPVENLHSAFKHRMQQVPDYLRGARVYLSQKPGKIPVEWLHSAAVQAQAGASYFRGLHKHPLMTQKFQNPARLQPLCDQAAVALDDYVRFLQHDLAPVATGSYACGVAEFRSLLREKHFLDVEPDVLHALGEKLFNETRAQLLALTREMRGDDDLEQALADIRDDYPRGGPDAVLDAYRHSMKAACDFVSTRQLVSVPASQILKVMHTPEYLRNEIPFAAYEEPCYNDPQQLGHYYVTPAVSEGDLLAHNQVSIDLTSVHEAFPGHHLQFVTANTNPVNSLPRLLNASATLYEGWALYCEDLMQEQGYLNQPGHRLMMLHDRLWRALRVMLDVELHCRGLSVDEAVHRMCRELGFSVDEARADLAWYIQNPGVPMGYATGWALIRALRAQQSQAGDFDLKDFHNKLLSVGSCALPLVICRAFGQDAWLAARANVFID
ncbi:MAG: DUF885 domain-containing protein [Gammaproteobacteria bacterium]|nr:DUF885 domain-containing protein [Gammaproteobacteria bacterium]